MKDQVEYLRGKAVAWSDALRTKRLTPGEAWYCLNSTIMKTIEYSLMATTISKDEMAYIMAPILSAALPKSKIQSRMPRDLVYGTLESRGLGIHNPWHTQHIFNPFFGMPTATTPLPTSTLRIWNSSNATLAHPVHSGIFHIQYITLLFLTGGCNSHGKQYLRLLCPSAVLLALFPPSGKMMLTSWMPLLP
jgi:hypothetical protein